MRKVKGLEYRVKRLVKGGDVEWMQGGGGGVMRRGEEQVKRLGWRLKG